MTPCPWIVLSLALLASATAAAQGAPARPEAAASAAAPLSDPAAMERARRQAANPMRVILEASRIARKPAVAVPVVAAAPAAAPAPVARPLPARAEPEVAPAPAPAPVVTAVAVEPAAEPVLQAPPPEPPSRELRETLAAPAAQQPPLRVARAPVASFAGVSAEPLPASTPVIALAAQPSALPIGEPGTPRPVRIVEPDIPQRVLDQLGRVADVTVELSLRRDGSVAGVNVLPPAPRQLMRYVVEALQQWRFEPLAAETTHRVQLIFPSGS